MANLKDVLVIASGPIKDDAGLHGANIGYVYANMPPVELTVDMELEHDGWVPITNPNPWRDTGKQGWIKKSRVVEESVTEKQYLVTIASDDSATIKRIS